jgi:UDP-N-acetylmuramate dehydrogenase
VRILSNSLSHHTSFKTGGLAEAVVAPQSRDELISLATRIVQHRILGNGSNTLAGDEGYAGTVIKTTALRHIEISGDLVHVEAGLGLPALVRVCSQHGLGGCEYLVSVPGTVGGAICMNAGRGRGKKQAIADHVVTVEVFNGRSVVELSANEIKFDYRYSLLQSEPAWIVLAATLKLPRLPIDTIQRNIHDRIEYVRVRQDLLHPNAGTIFSHGFKTCLAQPGQRVGGAAWSAKTANWINNMDRATTGDILQLIQEMRTRHGEQGYPLPTPEIHYLGNVNLANALDSLGNSPL